MEVTRPGAPAAAVTAAVRRHTEDRRWWLAWTRIALVAALAVTTADAFVLQQKRSFFTGGFLAEDHLRGPVEAVLFLVGAVASNAGLTGLFAACGLWVAGRMRVGLAASALLATMIAALPLLVASFVENQLYAYLGGAFDLGLMFDLAGRKPTEMLAVAGSHLLRIVLICVPAIGIVALLIYAVHRWRPGRAFEGKERPRPRRVLARMAIVAACGVAVSTGMRVTSDAYDNGLRRTPAGQAYGAVVQALSDWDRDGYGLLGRPGDPAPFDGQVYPYAVDWPGNGVDENGVAGDLPAGTPAYEETAGDAPAFVRRPPVVFVYLETFRADAVGAQLDGRTVTPVLDRLAAAGISSRHAYSHNGYTVQSRLHAFSGSLAGLRGGQTLVDDFKANGYEVGYFSGQDESFGGPDWDVGFRRADVAYDARQDRAKRYSTFTTAGSLAVPMGVVHERIRAFLARRDAAMPLFLYVNLHDTHFPYYHEGLAPLVSAVRLRQEEIGPARAEDLRRMYLNAAANVDRAIGEILDDVEKAVGRAPGVIVSADHGESLYDEGFLGHGYALNEAQTRIPLVVANLPMRVREPFGQADFREAIWRALASRDSIAGPMIETEEGPPVFQYLGNLDRPRQIAMASRDGRSLFDFREGQFRAPTGAWTREPQGSLDGAAWLHLVRTWERVRLARARAGADK